MCLDILQSHAEAWMSLFLILKARGRVQLHSCFKNLLGHCSETEMGTRQEGWVFRKEDGIGWE